MSLVSNWKQQPGWVKILTASVPVLAGVLAIINTAESAMNAWDTSGLPTFATRGWVRTETRDTRQSARDLQLELAMAKREATETARNKLEIDALRYDEEGKVRARQEIRRLDDTLAALDDQLRTLRRIRNLQ